MKKIIIKLLIVFCVVGLSLSVIATSCSDKPSGSGSNNNNNLSGGNNQGGSSGDGNQGNDNQGDSDSANQGNDNQGGGTNTDNTSKKRCELKNICLKLAHPSSGALPYVNIKDNIVTISADGLAKISPHVYANDEDRGFFDVLRNSPNSIINLFDIKYPNDKVALFFVSRSSITFTTLERANSCSNASETEDNILAQKKGGGHCREYQKFSPIGKFPAGTVMKFASYLGTVFDSDETAPRGLMRCSTDMLSHNSENKPQVIGDNTKFDKPDRINCHLAIVENEVTPGAVIDDNWANNSKWVKEVELYAIAISIDDKTIPNWSTDPEFNLDKFSGTIDSVAFQKMLDKNDWADLKFTVKIVPSTP